MKKVLIINSHTDPETRKSLAVEIGVVFASTLEKEIRKNLEIHTNSTNFKESQRQVPRGYDLYLIHPTDVDNEDLVRLREECPSSLVYGTNRRKSDVPQDERRGYSGFVCWISEDEVNALVKQIGIL